MPSPFPGMDPYLEGPLWTSFHFTLGAELVRQLAPQLPERYLILPVERFVVDTFEDLAITRAELFPDVGIADTEASAGTDSDHAIAEAPLRLATVVPSPVPHVSIEIRDAFEHELVTAIEILSPTNKRRAGRTEYLEKRQRILQSTVHLLEIDLLRAGIRVPMQQPLPDAPYFVFLSRGDQRPMTDIWPIYLNQRLPVVPVPLLPDDPDLSLDLQASVTSVYDLLRCERLLDYTEPPSPRLQGKAKTWVETRLREAGKIS